MNPYLKEFFQLNNVRYRTGKRAKIHIEMAMLIYNASKLAADRIHAELTQLQAFVFLKRGNYEIDLF